MAAAQYHQQAYSSQWGTPHHGGPQQHGFLPQYYQSPESTLQMQQYPTGPQHFYPINPLQQTPPQAPAQIVQPVHQAAPQAADSTDVVKVGKKRAVGKALDEEAQPKRTRESDWSEHEMIWVIF